MFEDLPDAIGMENMTTLKLDGRFTAKFRGETDVAEIVFRWFVSYLALRLKAWQALFLVFDTAASVLAHLMSLRARNYFSRDLYLLCNSFHY